MRTLVSRLIVVGFAASGFIVFLAAQVPTFSLIVHVHDDALRSPNGLDFDDFDVRIDGRPRPIRSVRPAGPFSLLLLLDTSASMNRVVPPSELAEAVAAVVAQLRPAEHLRVAAFNSSVEMGPDFGATPATMSGFLKTLAYSGATRLYDALDTSLTTLERQPGRRIIVVLSDGSDTASRMTGDDVLKRALRSDVQVWALLRDDRLPGVKQRGPDRSFMRIVQDTGGVSVQPKNTVDFASSLSDVVRYLREQYALEVDAAAFDRDVHRVDVRTRRRGLTLHAPRSAALAVPCAECAVPGNSGSAPGAAPEAPALVSPPEGAVLTFFPRLIDFEWTAVRGAARYRIEVDCYECCATDKWCSEVNPSRVQMRDVMVPKFTIEFPGNQPGRWRVCALDDRDRPGPKTAWRHFTFYRPAVPAVAPPSFRDPATGATISGPGVVGPKAVYSPSPRYPQSAMKDRISGEVFMEAVVDETGRVQSARVTRSLRADLDDSAVATLKTWRFEPARRDGQAVPAQIIVTMSFNLK
jgi:Ca-activated chloride channel family protein